MPTILTDAYERARNLDRLGERLTNLEGHIARLMDGTTAEHEARGIKKDEGIVAKIGRIDRAMQTDFVGEVRGLLRSVDADFSNDELDVENKRHLQIAIAKIFTNPSMLKDPYDRRDTIYPVVEAREDGGTLSGAFMRAKDGNGHVVRTDVDPGGSSHRILTGDRAIPAAEELRLKVIDLANRVGDATEKYYEQGHHRKTSPSPASSPFT